MNCTSCEKEITWPEPHWRLALHHEIEDPAGTEAEPSVLVSVFCDTCVRETDLNEFVEQLAQSTEE